MSVPSATPPSPSNEPVRSYAPGSAERASLVTALETMRAEVADIPMVVGGEEIRTGDLTEARAPHDKAHVLGRAHLGDRSHAARAIAAALAARRGWSRWSQAERSAVFLKAAELAATTWRDRLNAATMHNQGKTMIQAEIDAACELVDFFRFNAHWAAKLVEQPISPAGFWNSLEPRPLEGFVHAITPFNFTAIAANLPAAPAIVGNTVVWKPSPLALRSAHEVMSLLRESGLPPGVINLVLGSPEEVVEPCLAHPELAGVHFTGSTGVFRSIWQRVAQNIGNYRGFPRLVGETGGKDFVFAHASADVDALAVALVRGAFEFSGQKCSAASRAYLPRSIWPALRERLVGHVEALRMGDPTRDLRTMVGAVIDERAFARLTGVQNEAKSSPEYTLVAGGHSDASVGWFVAPTIVESRSPGSRLMSEEFFGPILTVWVYDDADVDEALAACDQTSGYALTGSVFAQDRAFLVRATSALADAAGNFYLNDKPTGAVVGQQPFGGARASGTNDKAGSPLNLLRWVSPRTLKETFSPPLEVGYPSTREA